MVCARLELDRCVAVKRGDDLHLARRRDRGRGALDAEDPLHSVLLGGENDLARELSPANTNAHSFILFRVV